jgi:secreted PhoX family phosphatase
LKTPAAACHRHATRAAYGGGHRNDFFAATMRTTPDLSRRRLLQSLASAPVLPLAASMAGWSFSADAAELGEATYTFGGMAAPSLLNPAQMATTYVASTLTKQRASGRSTTYSLGYETFFLTGQMVADTRGGTVLAGGYVDINGQPIRDLTDPNQRQFFSDCPDGMSLLTLPGGKSKKGDAHRVFAVVQFEYTTRNVAGGSMYGLLPSQIAVLSLDQDAATGKLSLVSYCPVDTSPAHGLWITCGASLSPWNTHLSSEEYEPDATLATNTQLRTFSQNLFGNPDTAKPYHYGHLPEITVAEDGTATVKKHYCLGRISHELVQVCPDQRTVLMGDDATNGGAFMFVADKAADLSAGTLYVAKWTQTSGTGPGAGTLRWIELGHATSAEIEAMANTLRASDIMDVAKTDPLDNSYTAIRYNGTTNWVRLKPGMEKAAAFLETHRYAALVGGSLGFTKWEGTTLNAKDKVAYVAMSYIYKSMVDGTTDIKVQGPVAGAVYALNLRGDQVTLGGKKIKSQWVPVDMAPPPALVGVDLAVRDGLGNSADPEHIANPDNLKFSEKMRTLFIGEDSGNHVNNFLWAYNVDTQKLSRLLSTPSGAESTGLHAVDHVNGFSYIMSNFQHPGDWETPRHDIVKPTLDPLVRANYNDRFSSAVGYVTLTGVLSGR